MPSVAEQMAVTESRSTPDLVAARFLLKPGRKYQDAVDLFEPYKEIKEPNEDARSAGASLIKQATTNKAARGAYIYVNNRLENAIRPTALGKKHWLFIGEADAGERGAVIYSVIESCRRRGIDPYAYLKDVLTRLPKMTNHQIPEVTPAAWAKARPEAQGQAAA